MKRMNKYCIKKGIDPGFDKSFLLSKLRTAKNIQFLCVGDGPIAKGINMRGKLNISVNRERYIYSVDITVPNMLDWEKMDWERLPEEYIKFRYRRSK